LIEGDVKVADPPDGWIADVGVTVQPADADDISVVGGDEDSFPGLVETVPTRLPFSDEAGESVEAGRSRFVHQGFEPVNWQAVAGFETASASSWR
jgi:hypothetical protein